MIKIDVAIDRAPIFPSRADSAEKRLITPHGDISADDGNLRPTLRAINFYSIHFCYQYIINNINNHVACWCWYQTNFQARC